MYVYVKKDLRKRIFSLSTFKVGKNELLKHNEILALLQRNTQLERSKTGTDSGLSIDGTLHDSEKSQY